MHDTGKEKREPLPHCDCRVRRRRLGAAAGREPERAKGEAAEPRAIQPALPSSASVSARRAGPLSRSPGRPGPPRGGAERSGPSLRQLWPKGAPTGRSSRCLRRFQPATECRTRAPRAEPAAAVSPEEKEEGAAMGLLSQGSPLSWEETKRHADHVRRHGILQFLHIYHAVKDRHKDVLKWGDEVSARGLRPRRAPLSGHLASPLFGETRPAPPRRSAPCGAPRGSPDASPPGCAVPALPRRAAGALPSVGPCPSLLTRLPSPIHSFLGFSPSLNKWVRRWEGASVSKCDIWCLREFSVWCICRPCIGVSRPVSKYAFAISEGGPGCPRRAVAARIQVFRMFASAPSPAGSFLNLQLLLISSLSFSSHTLPRPPRFATTF